jgi:ligand-binding SRPBCC domain-containing protein
MARIAEFAWNSHFIDEQVRGPFTRFRHRHAVTAELRDGVEGTLVDDDIEYELPFGIFGRLASGFVRRNLAHSFAYRQKRLPEILSAAAQQAVQRA